jgi:hypothetical protein
MDSITLQTLSKSLRFTKSRISPQLDIDPKCSIKWSELFVTLPTWGDEKLKTTREFPAVLLTIHQIKIQI